MSADEFIRRRLTEEINTYPGLDSRESLETLFGQVWDTQELQRDFEIGGFRAPFVFVVRKSDGVLGCLVFRHEPRFYFSLVTEQQP